MGMRLAVLRLPTNVYICQSLTHIERWHTLLSLTKIEWLHTLFYLQNLVYLASFSSLMFSSKYVNVPRVCNHRDCRGALTFFYTQPWRKAACTDCLSCCISVTTVLFQIVTEDRHEAGWVITVVPNLILTWSNLVRDKRDFNFNFSLVDSNIPLKPAYWVVIL